MQTATTESAHAKASPHAQDTDQANSVIGDLLGRVQAEVRLGGGTGISELPVQTWPSGLYTATLSADGIPVSTIKLIVQR